MCKRAVLLVMVLCAAGNCKDVHCEIRGIVALTQSLRLPSQPLYNVRIGIAGSRHCDLMCAMWTLSICILGKI